MTPDEKMQLEDMKMQVEAEAEDVGMLEDEMYEGSSPQGRFTKKAMNVLIKSMNDMASLFGIEDKLPPIGGDASTFPPEVMRLLDMFKKAVEDAVEMDMLAEDALLDWSGIVDDSGIQMLAGKLQMASKDKKFQKFLKKPQPKVEVEIEVEEGPKEMSESEMDQMFMSRM